MSWGLAIVLVIFVVIPMLVGAKDAVVQSHRFSHVDGNAPYRSWCERCRTEDHQRQHV